MQYWLVCVEMRVNGSRCIGIDPPFRGVYRKSFRFIRYMTLTLGQVNLWPIRLLETSRSSRVNVSFLTLRTPALM